MKVSPIQSSEEAKVYHECTFHPSVNENVCDNTEDIYERSLIWQQKLALKVKLLEECAAQPPRPMTPMRAPEQDSFRSTVARSPSPPVNIAERCMKLSDFLDEITRQVDQSLRE